MSNLQGGFKLE